MGIGKSNFYEKFVRTGRVHLIAIGPRNVRVDEAELDAVVVEVIEKGKRIIRAPQPRNAASGQFIKTRKSPKEIRP